MNKKLIFALGICFVLLAGTLFLNIDNEKEFSEVEKEPFREISPELQDKINSNINEFYFQKYNQGRVIFQWD